MTANNIWQWFQENEASTGGVTDKIQNYLTAAGYTGATNEALYRWLGARGYEGSLADRIYQFEYFNTFRYIDISAKLVLEKFGTDAHVWIPGIGYFNGLEAGNYIDSAGTQAGLVDNPVGLVMDAEGSLGAELVTNGGFDSATGWTAGAGWTISGGVASATGPTGDGLRTSQAAYTTGKVYLVSFDKTGTQNISVYLRASGPFTTSLSGRVFMYITAGASATRGVEFYFLGTGGTIDNVSVREVTGAITATQGTTANKPILRRGAVNLLLRSEEFSNASWGKSAINVASGATAPNASITAFTASEDTTTGTHDLTQSLTISAGQIQTYSIYVKASGRNLVRIMLTWNSVVDQVHADFDLENGTVGSAVTTGAGVSAETPKITAVGNGWYRCVISGSCPTGTTLICYARGMQSAGVVSYTGSGASAYQIWGAQLELGSTASEYIPTTTAAASSSSGDYYWQFDGSNDSLALSSVPFQMADDHCVVAGANAVAGAAATIFSIGNTASNNDVIAMDYTSNFFRVWWRDTALTLESLDSPTTRNQQILVGSMRKTGNTKIGRINGSQYGTGSIVMGSTTLNTAAIGVFSRITLSRYMTGSIYPVIAIKGTVSDADLLVLERWVGSLSGVSI